MNKLLLFFIGYVFFSTANFTYLFANEKNLIPLKKPILTDKQIKSKISAT